MQMIRSPGKRPPQTLLFGMVVLATAACTGSRPELARGSLPVRPLGRTPNIVVILADDMGYGDLSALNPESRIPTVHMDRLARQGMVFTDAHAGSAVCTPTRYGILTGRYSWRSRLKSGVLNGYSGSLIESDRLTIARLLAGAGYRTVGIGKWHLGLDWAPLPDSPTHGPRETHIDYSRPIRNGPRALGFDYYLGIPASLDMPPYVYIENNRVLEPPTETIPARSGLAFYRGGPCAPGFRHIDVLPELTRRAVACIDQHAKDRPDQPLFLYFALPAPHTPILPTEEYRGRSRAGLYGDFVCEVDATVGAVADALDRNGLARNTLLIVTSDNGCSPAADLDQLHSLGHHPSYLFRGAKADIFEGGHRIPFIARWPAVIAPSTVCDRVICLTDLMATFAAITGRPLPADGAEDSFSFLSALRGRQGPETRQSTVHHSINGSFSIRRGPWKLALCPGSGGWSAPRPAKARRTGLPAVQLYDLAIDIEESRNLQARFPQIVDRLTVLLRQIVDHGRSTAGPTLMNAGRTSIWGPGRSAPSAKDNDR